MAHDDQSLVILPVVPRTTDAPCTAAGRHRPGVFKRMSQWVQSPHFEGCTCDGDSALHRYGDLRVWRPRIGGNPEALVVAAAGDVVIAHEPYTPGHLGDRLISDVHRLCREADVCGYGAPSTRICNVHRPPGTTPDLAMGRPPHRPFPRWAAPLKPSTTSYCPSNKSVLLPLVESGLPISRAFHPSSCSGWGGGAFASRAERHDQDADIVVWGGRRGERADQ